MQKKLLYVSIYIKFLLIFSTFAHAKEQTSKFKGLPTKYDLIKRARFELKPNGELFKKSLVNHVQEHKEVIKILEDIDMYERRYKMIQQVTIDTIDIIERKTSMIENTISNFTKGINSNNDIIDALFFILEQTAFFGNVVLSFPEITRKILKSQNMWKEIIIWSFNFTSKMEYLVDESIITEISLAIEELNNTKQKSELTNYRENNYLPKKKTFRKGMTKQKRGPKLIKYDL